MFCGKVFQTPSGQSYAYITETNRIVTLLPEWYGSIDSAQQENIVFQALEDTDEIIGSPLDAIEWPMTAEEYISRVNDSIPSVILEITQECTLRCEYCVYSGNYEKTRTHSDCHMTMDTVRRGLDFYAEHSKGHSHAQISFYGGEALIRFDIVQYAVEYARKIFDGRSLSFRISSNGTTLTDQVIDWLNINEDISVTVTINGFGHDTYRKFPTGESSLDIIMQNIRRIHNNYPDLWSRVDFLANISSLQELIDLRRFYMDQIGKPPLLITGILEYGGNEKIQSIIHITDTKEAIEEVHRLYCDNLDPYIKPYFHADIYEICLRPVGQRERICKETACCMPFMSNLFISANGKFGPCERVGAWSRCGDIDQGINIDNTLELLRTVLDIQNKRCRNCWCQRLCTICFKDFQAETDGGISLPEALCQEMRAGVEEALRLFCEMGERNPSTLEEIEKSVWEYEAKHCSL